MSSTRRFWVWLTALVAAATAIRIFAIERLDPPLFTKYLRFGDALLAGTIEPDRIPDLSPGYLWFVAAMRGLGSGPVAIRALQIVLLSGVALLTAALAHHYGGRIAAVIAAILVLANRSALVNAADFEPETLLLFFSTLGLFLAVRSNAWHGASMAGVAFGIATVMRPVALLPAAVLLAWQTRGAWKRGVAFAAGTSVPVVIALAVNFTLTGSALLMDPGTVFYEGMNPNATAYAGVPPRIIKDLEPEIGGADAMHVAYRIVAACAGGSSTQREDANRFWAAKARAFAASHPKRAVELTAGKSVALISAYNAYDVPSMVLIDRALSAWPWIPWSVLFPLAVAGAVLMRRRAAPLILYIVAAGLPPLVFFVTARHRNPLVPALAVLAALAITQLRHIGRRRAIVAVLLVAAAAVALSIEGDLQREDRFLWTAFFETSRHMHSAAEPIHLAAAATWLPESVPSAQPQLVRALAVRELTTTSSPARMLSLAIALLDAGDAARADDVLRRLEEIDYHPARRTRAVSSVAYYRARAALPLGDRNRAEAQIQRALDEAEGDADVLALTAVLDVDPGAAAMLDRLHDPATRDYALARAFAFAGDSGTARIYAQRAASACPTWQKPRTLSAAL